MISLQFILILAIGSMAGWFAAQITGTRSKGLAVDMVIGVIGAALATLALPEFLAWGRLPAMFAGAVFFSTLMVMTVSVFRKARIARLRGMPQSEEQASA